MTPRQAAQIREAIKAAKHSQLARDAWALDGPRRRPWELIGLFRAHRKLVENHARKLERKKRKAAA